MIPGVSIQWAVLLICCQQSYTVAHFKSFVSNLFKQRGWHVLGKSSLLFSSVCEFEQEAFRSGYYTVGTNPFSLAHTEGRLSIRYWLKTHTH